MNTHPVRLQLSRRKGFKLTSPNGLPIVVVGRPSKWGNPFSVKAHGREEAVRRFEQFAVHSNAEHWLNFREQVKRELKGKNLACWCKSTDSCHADVLLKIANE